ncbi:MAG: hypothetical protein NXI23_12495 [Bacteroidetes bacterium]|jgi:AcrR family transcriptional regulator|nr:hypothetical protein [Bacteroidota bacterium]
MKRDKKLQWIKEGYYMASKDGIKNLNVESIGRNINKNKSSFYHYFGDIEIFETELLEFHVQQVEIFAQLAANCERIRPDLLNLFIEHKTDLFFHKQLRINRENQAYKKCYEEAFIKLEQGIMNKWTDFLGLNNQQLFSQTFLNLISENFLLQITHKSFNFEWLNNYLEEVHAILKQMNSKK